MNGEHPGPTPDVLLALARAAAIYGALEAQRVQALHHKYITQLAVGRATVQAKSPYDEKLLRAKTALHEATEALRDVTERTERALARLNGLRMRAQYRRRDEALAESQRQAAVLGDE